MAIEVSGLAQYYGNRLESPRFSRGGFSFEWFSGIILVKYNLTEAQGARSGDRSAEH